MLKRNLHIILSLLLVITTTTSIWSHLVSKEDAPIELKTEKEGETDSEEGEKEKELDDLDDELFHGNFHASSSALLSKKGSAVYLEANHRVPQVKRYIRYHRLKIAC